MPAFFVPDFPQTSKDPISPARLSLLLIIMEHGYCISFADTTPPRCWHRIMLAASKLYSDWAEALRAHGQWMTVELETQMQTHAEDETRMQTPCALHTRFFLQRQGI